MFRKIFILTFLVIGFSNLFSMDRSGNSPIRVNDDVVNCSFDSCHGVINKLVDEKGYNYCRICEQPYIVDFVSTDHEAGVFARSARFANDDVNVNSNIFSSIYNHGKKYLLPTSLLIGLIYIWKNKDKIAKGLK